jgi:hypothetical protein
MATHNMVTDVTTPTTPNALTQEELKTQLDKKLSRAFVIIGIISFSLGAIVNWYTIQRVKGGKV